jgi:hypothetical protein
MEQLTLQLLKTKDSGTPLNCRLHTQPMQLFVRPHVRRVQHLNKRRLSFYQIISAYAHGIDRKQSNPDVSMNTGINDFLS